MRERLFGVETEYAITGLKASAVLPRSTLLERLLSIAPSRLPLLWESPGRSMYLANGARFYIDCGLHPEFATPECANPWDVVRYLRAGDRILAGLVDQLASEDGAGVDIFCYRCNVDYSGGTTWGCHESYLHQTSPTELPKHLIPHLVSRIIYSGAGGLDPLAAGIEFTLSPRTPHMQRVVSGDSTYNRGIFHTKDEPLCGGNYHRLHILFGESLCSDTAAWLKTATTALIVAMVDAGLAPGREVELSAPLEAARTVASDPQCRAKVRLASGRRATALDIQRHYLEKAQAHLAADFMPPWAAEVCRRWREMLALLERAPGSVATTLDWAIKYALYRDHARLRGLSWETLPVWRELIGALNAALPKSGYCGEVSPALILGPDNPVPEEVKRLTPLLEANGLRWEDLPRFLQLRREFFEIDTRFARVGEQGIFQALDRRAVLTHRFPGVDNIEHAMENPPAIGRARLRGEAVRSLAGQPRCGATWTGVWDHDRQRRLDLSDPFASEALWRPMEESAAVPSLALEMPGDEDRHVSLIQEWLRAMRMRR